MDKSDDLVHYVLMLRDPGSKPASNIELKISRMSIGKKKIDEKNVY